METQLSLHEIKLDRYPIGLHDPVYQVTFKMRDGNVKGAMTVTVPVEGLSDVDVVIRARDLLKATFLSLAEEVGNPSKLVDQDISEIVGRRARQGEDT